MDNIDTDGTVKPRSTTPRALRNKNRWQSAKNNSMYILTVIVVGLALIIGACAPASLAPGAPSDMEAKPSVSDTEEIPVREWKMSVVTNRDSSWAKGAELFAHLVKQRTDGKIHITVYPDAQLAGGNQLKELMMLQEGSINFTYHSNLLYSNLDASFAVISLPWIFTDYSQVDAALSGASGSQLLNATAALNIVGLAFGENGFRQLTNNKLDIRRPDDLKGLRIRIPGVKLYDSIYQALGASPVEMDFGKVVEAIRDGEIDGQENPVDIITSAKLYEVQKHLTVWNYSYDAIILGMNRQDWEGLPEVARDIVKQAAIEASTEQKRLSRDAARTQVDMLRTQVMSVTELTPEEISAFRSRMLPVYEEWSPKIGEPLVRQFQQR